MDDLPTPENEGQALPEGAASAGGHARKKALSAARRQQIARMGAAARHRDGGAENPIPALTDEVTVRFAGMEFECAVLAGEIRVISERAFSRAIGHKRGGSHWLRRKQDPEGANLPVFLSAKNLRAFISDDLANRLSKPIYYLPKHGALAHGIDATLMSDILQVWVSADAKGALTSRQKPFATAARMILSALEKTAIVALIDQETGWQEFRTKQRLIELVEDYLAEEIRQWVRTFPANFFKQLCRLKGVPFRADYRFPKYFGHIINDLVYDRLAPNLRAELDRLNPVTETGRRKHKKHQLLSEHVGNPRLLYHLGLLEAYAEPFKDGDWDGYMEVVNRRLKRFLPKKFDGASIFDSTDTK